VYACGDSCTDGSLENNFGDEISSLLPDSTNSPSFITHTLNLVLELKPLYDSHKYAFLRANEIYPMIIASNLKGPRG